MYLAVVFYTLSIDVYSELKLRGLTERMSNFILISGFQTLLFCSNSVFLYPWQQDVHTLS